jgi:DNA-binding winged helix-turn-helix (wHTH) protein/tetratricopeptide (TPR) repeat protein
MSAAPPVLCFGVYRLDPAARELYRAGRLLVLSPRMFDCLVWLLEHRERAVGRDELSAAVWSRVDITDAQIDQLIRKVRRAVGDSGSDQEIIRTIPRFGYRWVAEVQPAEAVDAAAPAQPARRPVPVRRPLMLAGATLTVGIAMAVALRLTLFTQAPDVPPPDAAAAPQRIEGIAVLPVRVEAAADGEWDWLRLGLMDLIGSRLRESGLTVVPADNVLALTGNGTAAPDPAAVHAAIGVRYVAAPSLRRTATGWRLHLDLSDSNGAAREVEAHADEAATSARDAADRLLVLLGRPRLADARGQEPVEVDVLMSRIDAAMYGRDYVSARHLIESAPPAVQAKPPLQLRLAEITRVSGDIDRAGTLFQAVLDSQATTPLDPWTHSDALHGLVIILTQTNRTDAAMARLDELAQLARNNDLPLVYGRALTSRAALHTMARHDDKADSDFAQARVALELAGDTLGLARVESNHAASLILRRRYAEAQTLLGHAIPRLERFAAGDALLSALGNQIHMHLVLLEPEQALAVARHARVQAERLDSTRQPQLLMRQEARALLANGRLEEAGRVLDALIPGLDPQKVPDLRAGTLITQAQLALAAARPEQAAALAARALEYLSRPELSAPMPSRNRAIGWVTRIHALRRQGADREAAAEQQGFSAWAAGRDDPAIVVLTDLAEAEQAAIERRPDANALFEAALAFATRLATPADIAQVAGAYGRMLLESGNLADAARVIGQTATWAERDYDCALLQVQLYHALGQVEPWRLALARARALAGERAIPPSLSQPPLSTHPLAGWPGTLETTAQASALKP